MISIDLGSFAQALKKQLEERRHLILEAAQKTVNKLAMQGVEDIQREMRTEFSAPSRFTLNALKWIDNSAPLQAAIDWRSGSATSSVAGGLRPEQWLRAQITGGSRHLRAHPERN